MAIMKFSLGHSLGLPSLLLDQIILSGDLKNIRASLFIIVQVLTN